MEDSVDVKALRAKFNSRTNTSDTSSRDSSSPKSPRPGFGRVALVTENDLAHHRLSPTIPPPLAGSGLPRFPVPPRVEPAVTSIPRQYSFSQLPPTHSIRAPVQTAELSRIKQTGELLQNIMLVHHRPPGTKLPSGPATATKPQQLTRQRATGEVAPLRRPLPTERPRPMKPKRPPVVNLGPFLRNTKRSLLLPDPKNINGFRDRKISVPIHINRPQLPQRDSKPSRLPRQIASVDIEDPDDMYDDIAHFDNNDSMNDNSSQCAEEESDEVYEFIDEDQVELNQIHVDKKPQKDAKKQKQQEQKEQLERQKRENELRKNFQLEGREEVLHIARVRHDWHGGSKLDLSVQQGETVEIIRVKNNPEGKWLVRSLTGNYGYISNTCVDINYEEVKRKLLQARKLDTTALPPPPPDPPQMYGVEFSSDMNSMLQEEDEYDDVQPISENFPPPPLEISMDPKMEKELRKKFKFNGPITVLHTMMVDPNAIIKKPGGKDLPVTHGEIVDVIQLTSTKKVLCRNQFGKCGFVATSLLLPMEGDIYDDVGHLADVYDND
ncbi:FYN-binding protein 1 [Thalassophryne amazonica]|uniref:FYN-binding protein 1 n=1 Tax=Thalassophryne amazonica TaxID=390379 RepID=UPI001471312E|nr:FYN-binding protein 1 [Thalassophryne amazonica]